MVRIAVLVLVCGMFAAAQQPASPYPPRMNGTKVETYKSIGGVKLDLFVFEPPGHSSADKTAAIVFFFGGGWQQGTPRQFENQCRYLASRGMVAIAADYRVGSRHQSKVPDSVRDAKSAIRWVRKNASQLGIDSARIAAGGGSAGGHLAAAAAALPGFNEPDEDSTISSRPDALVLFNPVLVLAGLAGSRFEKDLQERSTFADVDPIAVSPYHHIAGGAPPTIIFHGRSDTTVPYATAEMFARKMAAAGNRCELAGFDGETHGFFNYGRAGNKAYHETLRRTDEFLTSLGYLKSKAAQ
jgi:acetyl esterase